MNPSASMGADGIKCLVEDAGVDLNRNYGVDWGAGNRADYGRGAVDECQDQCGECYRGQFAFSELETQNVKKFLEDNQSKIKFVSNFHSSGNS